MTDQTFQDDELVYVDPESRTVVGKVEWTKDGDPKSAPYKNAEGKGHWRKFFPFGTYKAMKNTYRIEGKRMEQDGDMTLDEALPELLNDTFFF